MRVTKNIKEYVEKKVNEIYEPKIDEIMSEYYNELHGLENVLEEIKEKAEKEIQKVLKDTGFHKSYCPEESILSVSSIKNDILWEKSNSKARELKRERDDKINEIIVTLELGGNKKDLEKMLSEIII